MQSLSNYKKYANVLPIENGDDRILNGYCLIKQELDYVKLACKAISSETPVIYFWNVCNI